MGDHSSADVGAVDNGRLIDYRPQIQFKNGSGNLGPQINAHEKQKK